MAAYGIPDDPAYRTTSRFRAWLLHALWGYKLLKIKRQPRAHRFSRRLVFQETYVLCPREMKH
ncbi:MAG: hypothetical protein IT368_03570 [Candidatus Hydrogenedentes bacterium]|nr:hypothetical protein [Candidatus Hydrogenedentota bacterium]